MFALFTKKKEPIVVGTNRQADKGELETHSPTWLVVKTWATEHIEKLRIKNDSPNNTEIQTAVYRGQIRALKNLLELPEDRKGILNRE